MLHVFRACFEWAFGLDELCKHVHTPTTNCSSHVPTDNASCFDASRLCVNVGGAVIMIVDHTRNIDMEGTWSVWMNIWANACSPLLRAKRCSVFSVIVYCDIINVYCCHHLMSFLMISKWFSLSQNWSPGWTLQPLKAQLWHVTLLPVLVHERLRRLQ